MRKSSIIRGRSYSVQEPMSKDPRVTKKRVRFNLPNSSSGSSRNNSRSSESLLEIHLEPQMPSDSIANILFSVKALQPPQPERKPFPKRRMTVVEKLVEFQQNLFMDIDPLTDDTRRSTRARRVAEKDRKVEDKKRPVQAAKVKETEKIKKPKAEESKKIARKIATPKKDQKAEEVQIKKKAKKVPEKPFEALIPTAPPIVDNREPLPNEGTPTLATPTPPNVDTHKEILTLSQEQNGNYLKRGDIKEAMITLRTGFAAASTIKTDSRCNALANNSFTLGTFPQSFSFRRTRANYQLGVITPQHRMIQLQPGAQYVEKKYNTVRRMFHSL